MKAFWHIFWRGILIGTADLIPGVSGGTMALLTGIYPRFIAAIKSFNMHSLKMLLTGKWKDLWQYLDTALCIPLFIGAGLSIVLLARLIHYLKDHYPVPLWSFFMGLIIASTIFLLWSQKNKNLRMYHGLLLVAGVLMAALLSQVLPSNLEPTPMNMLLAGLAGFSVMLLPGISGSYVLLLIGIYPHVIEAVSRFDFPKLTLFAVGGVCGIMLCARLMSVLLNRAETGTIIFLSGLMAGSTYRLWPWHIIDATDLQLLRPDTYQSLTSLDPMPGVATLFVLIGILFAFGLQLVAKR